MAARAKVSARALRSAVLWSAALATLLAAATPALAQRSRKEKTPSAPAAAVAPTTSTGAVPGRLANTVEGSPLLPVQVMDNAAQLRDEALKSNDAYAILEALTTEFGPRPAGSEAEHRAALWAAGKMKELGFQNVRIESFPITAWERGEDAAAVLSPFPQRLEVAALGGSIATPPQGIDAEISLFKTYDELLAALPGSLDGKIAVVTEPMGRTQDGSSYGAAYRIRGQGPSEAAKRGAVAYLMRSLASDDRRLPHTGMLAYDLSARQIPAAALSAPDAEQLERMVRRGKPVRLRLVLTPTTRKATSDTVTGEIRGSTDPNSIVLIGGHLDSWDLGTGALDDGAGVATTLAAATLIKDLPQRPARTIRVALWGAEEIGVSGLAYATAHPAAEQARHVIASECDLGADHIYAIALPKGGAASSFGRSLGRLVAPLRTFVSPEPARDGGSDLEQLQGVPLASLNQDASRYFELHHSPDDTLDKIDPVQLNQNVAAWTVFAYLAADSAVNFRALASAPPLLPATVPGLDGPIPNPALKPAAEPKR